MNLNEFIAALEKLRDEGRGDYSVKVLNRHYYQWPWPIEVLEDKIVVLDEDKEVHIESN